MPSSLALTIGAAKSGSGKTTVTLALLSALTKRGYPVQSFKVGPDTIDIKWHTAITKCPGYTLDAWFSTQEECARLVKKVCLSSFPATSSFPGIAVIEGVMGLYDGRFLADGTGSTAQMAIWVNAPVVLVLDASSQGRSVAALAKGFVEFDLNVPFAGIICNNVGSARHTEILKDALTRHLPHIPLLGCLPKDVKLTLPSRHLGLSLDEMAEKTTTLREQLSNWVENNLNLDLLLNRLTTLCSSKTETTSVHTQKVSSGAKPDTNALDAALANKNCTPPLSFNGTKQEPALNISKKRVRIALAKDAAFCFGYEANYALLEEAGAKLIPFSPLTDAEIPKNCTGMILGGGYPELCAKDLAANASMLKAIHQFCYAGFPVLAEGGGFMYLMRSFLDAGGSEHNFVGVFPFSSKIHTKFQALGYREAILSCDTFLGPQHTRVRAHEFHYSSIVKYDNSASAFKESAMVLSSENTRIIPGVISPTNLPNVLACYIHMYFPSSLPIAKYFIESCNKAALA